MRFWKTTLEAGSWAWCAPARPRIFSARKVLLQERPNQRLYMEAIEKHDMVFAVGPGGSGKTYLAVAMAVFALRQTSGSSSTRASRSGSRGEAGLSSRDAPAED